jgi:arginine repressor
MFSIADQKSLRVGALAVAAALTLGTLPAVAQDVLKDGAKVATKGAKAAGKGVKVGAEKTADAAKVGADKTVEGAKAAKNKLAPAGHAVAGEVTKIDDQAKNIAIKTADGSEKVYKYSEKTVVSSLDDAGKATGKGAKVAALKGKEGGQVVLEYTGEGAEATATKVKSFSKASFHTVEGTVTKVDQAGHTVVVKTADGAEATYNVAKDVTVETGDGIVKGAEYAKEGEKVTVSYTQNAAKKVVHSVKRAVGKN